MRLRARELGNLEYLCCTLIQAMCDCPGVIVPLHLFYLRDQLSYYLQADLAKYSHPTETADVFRVFHLLEQYGREYLPEAEKCRWLNELRAIQRVVLDAHLMLLLEFLIAQENHLQNATTREHVHALELEVRELKENHSACPNALLLNLEIVIARHYNLVQQTNTTSYFTILMGRSKTATYLQVMLSWLALLQQTNAIALGLGDVKPYTEKKLTLNTIPYPFTLTDWQQLQHANQLAMHRLSREKSRKIPRILYQLRDAEAPTVGLFEKSLSRVLAPSLKKKLYPAKLHHWIANALPFASSLQGLQARYAYVPGRAEEKRDYFLRLSCVYALLEMEENKKPNAERQMIMQTIARELRALALTPEQLHCRLADSVKQPLVELTTSYTALLAERQRVGKLATLFQHDELSNLLRHVHEEINSLLQGEVSDAITLEEKAGWYMMITLRIQEIEQKRQAYAETPAVWKAYQSGLKDCGLFAAETFLAGLAVAIPYAVLGLSVSYASSLVAKAIAPGKGHLLRGLEAVKKGLLQELTQEILTLPKVAPQDPSLRGALFATKQPSL